MADEQVNTQEQVQDAQTQIPPVQEKTTSSLERIVKEYTGGQTPPPPQEEKKELKFDYSFIKALTEDDIKDVDTFLKGKNIADDELRYKIISANNVLKTFQRLADSRNEELKKLKDAPQISDEDAKEFIEGLQKDFKGTYTRFKDKYKLPEIDSAVNQVANGGVSERLEQWQDTVLVKELESQFKLGEGKFFYDSNDAYKPNTPSYEFRIRTERKERDLLQENEAAERSRK